MMQPKSLFFDQNLKFINHDLFSKDIIRLMMN